MTYKDALFEMFMAGQQLFTAGQFYAANNLFCACFELLKRSNATGKEKEINRVMIKLEESLSDDLGRAAFEEMNKKTGRFKDFEEYKESLLVAFRNALIKPNFGNVPFAEMRDSIKKNWQVYNMTKHGQTGRFDLNEELSITLMPEDVVHIEKCVYGAITMQYPNDIKKRFGI